MNEESKTEMKILGVMSKDDLFLVSGKMISGDVYDEIYFTCVETGGIWRLDARALPTGKGYEEGFRMIGLIHVKNSKILEEGYTLVSE